MLKEELKALKGLSKQLEKNKKIMKKKQERLLTLRQKRVYY